MGIICARLRTFCRSYRDPCKMRDKKDRFQRRDGDMCYFRALQVGDINKVVPIDKSSTVLTILLAFIIPGEPISALKCVCVVLIAAGTLLMIKKKESEEKQTKRTGLIYAVLSAVFASLTSILGKIGISDVESNLGTMIRTAVALVMSRMMVFATGKGGQAARDTRQGACHDLPFRRGNRRFLAVLL